MKKSLIALAVAGALAPVAAQAQSSVTIYGLIDQGYYQISNASANAKQKGVAAAVYSPRLGFKGTEDLGNGLKASFVLEQQLFIDTGAIDSAGTEFKRGSNLSLSGSFGTVTAGRITDPFYVAYIGGDVRASILTGSSLQPYLRAGSATNFGLLWVNNAISYTTPTMSGFKASIYQSFGEVLAVSSGGKQTGLTANYAMGPFTANAGTAAHYDNNGAKNGKANTLNFGYNFGPGEVRISSSTFKNPQLTSTRNYRIDSLNGKFSVSNQIVLSAGYYRFKDKNSLLASTGKVTGAQVDYLLSKRTTLYAVYGHSNDASVIQAAHGGGMAAASSTALISGAAAGASGSQTIMAIGVRHTF